MSPYLAPPLTPNHRNLSARAHARGTSFEAELAEFITDQTGNVRPADLEKLDAKQRKLESAIADLEAERGQQLAVAARFHSLTVEADRLRTQLATARGKRDMHRGLASESYLNASLRLGESSEGWQISGNLLGISLEQTRIADEMGKLIDAMAAELAAKEGEVLEFAQANGITHKPDPRIDIKD